jgi:hypothetical protein
MQKQADFAAAVTAPKKTALVSGASFAGRATAYRMNKLGYKVTVVEVAKDLKKGGTPVNIGDDKNGLMDKRQSGPCRRRRLLRLSGCRHGWVVGNNWCRRVGGCVSKNTAGTSYWHSRITMKGSVHISKRCKPALQII